MGLDGVELILAVEETFQITIEDEEAEKVRTVGDLHDLVISKVKLAPDTGRRVCMTSAAFYRTRRGIAQTLGIERRQIRPATRLDSILLEPVRREKWAGIEAAIGLPLPELQIPGSTILALIVLAPLLMVVLGKSLGLPDGAAWVLFALGLVGGFQAQKLLPPSLAVAFPETTVGELARSVLMKNSAEFADNRGTWTTEQVWETLCTAIMNQLGVERDQIKPEATFVEDLGVD